MPQTVSRHYSTTLGYVLDTVEHALPLMNPAYCLQGLSVAGGLPLLPPAGHVVVPRAVYDHLRHDWNDRVLEAAVRCGSSVCNEHGCAHCKACFVPVESVSERRFCAAVAFSSDNQSPKAAQA